MKSFFGKIIPQFTGNYKLISMSHFMVPVIVAGSVTISYGIALEQKGISFGGNFPPGIAIQRRWRNTCSGTDGNHLFQK